MTVHTPPFFSIRTDMMSDCTSRLMRFAHMYRLVAKPTTPEITGISGVFILTNRPNKTSYATH
jgi:hypothetical protein